MNGTGSDPASPRASTDAVAWSRDVAAGGWLRERLDADSWSTMHVFVPRGFAAYARVLHPAGLQRVEGGGFPSDDEWARMHPAEHAALAERIRHRPLSWREAAERFGTTLEPLARWPDVIGHDRRDDPNGWQQVHHDGALIDAPDEGRLEPGLLARVVDCALDSTSTPDSGWAALWEGWGGLLGDADGDSGAAAFGVDADGRPFSHPLPAVLPREVALGPRLRLPHRDHLLFRAAPRVWADASWPERVPWTSGSAPFEAIESPAVIWPDDRAWAVVTEIDLDSTIVAGSAELVRAICADPAIEALPIDEGSDFFGT
ncbi:MAG: hypothetical protein GXX90_11975 [Microbacteriaceae bacterium]|nr:hypothetical protein [Microbacteriaceae bacterium]